VCSHKLQHKDVWRSQGKPRAAQLLRDFNLNLANPSVERALAAEHYDRAFIDRAPRGGHATGRAHRTASLHGGGRSRSWNTGDAHSGRPPPFATTHSLAITVAANFSRAGPL
jgi:hypothetical protein